MIVVFLTAPPGLYPGAGNEIFRTEAAIFAVDPLASQMRMGPCDGWFLSVAMMGLDDIFNTFIHSVYVALTPAILHSSFCTYHELASLMSGIVRAVLFPDCSMADRGSPRVMFVLPMGLPGKLNALSHFRALGQWQESLA
jgi:hypothetical protein